MEMNLITGTSLALLSVFDIRNRKLPVSILSFWIIPVLIRPVLAILRCGPLSEQHRILVTALLGALPGIALTALSYVSDKVGKGDGVVLIILGLSENCSFVIAVTCIACITLSVFSGILCALRRAGRNTPMPFVPFLTGAYLVVKIMSRRLVS